MRTARLQMVATAPLAEVRYPRPVYMRYGHEWWQQLPDGRVALGGFRDEGGEAEWTHDAEPSDFVQGRIERFLRERLGVHAPITHPRRSTPSPPPPSCRRSTRPTWTG